MSPSPISAADVAIQTETSAPETEDSAVDGAADDGIDSSEASAGDLDTTADGDETSGSLEGTDEWSRMSPNDRPMGLVQITLDKGVKTTAIGQVYGLDFEIEGDGYQVNLFFDHYNRRVKVLDYEAEDLRAMVERVTWLADANEFDKVFFKAGIEDWQDFLSFGYQLEGILKYYFRGADAYVMSKFRSLERAQSDHVIDEDNLIAALMRRSREYEPAPLLDGCRIVRCRPEHIPQLVAVYRDVFETYPSPLTHPDYIQQTMDRSALYRAIVDADGRLISAASAEIQRKHSNAELTDCATVKSERGQGLMFHLLSALSTDLGEMGIMTPYTLARATSVGMNLVFYRLGFEFCGRLINNCDIYGQFEDMNIWVREPMGG
jgi:putative beta-lysine N-acetyltransferase